LTVQIPEPTNETVEPETVQIPALEAAALKATVRPELAVADTAYVEPPTVALLGAVELNVIVCELFPGVETENDCCTCGAGR
jgi:hypothetical protein